VDQSEENGIIAQCKDMQQKCAKNVGVKFPLQQNNENLEHIYAEIAETNHPVHPPRNNTTIAQRQPQLCEPYRSPPFDFDEMVNNMSTCQYIWWICCAFCNPDPNYI